MIFIIIPTYNRESTILRAINSCLKQKGEYKIVIVDDGSTDKTKTIVDECIANNPNKIIYYYKQNGGVCSAVNAGIEIAIKESKSDDDFILPLGSDDELLEGSIDMISKDIQTFGKKILFYKMISEEGPITKFTYDLCVCKYNEYILHEPMSGNDACVICSLHLLKQSGYRLPDVFSGGECYPYFKLMFSYDALLSSKPTYWVNKDVSGLTRSTLQTKHINNLIKLYKITLNEFGPKRKELHKKKYFGLSYLILSRSYGLLGHKRGALRYLLLGIYYSPNDIKRITMSIVSLLPRSLKITNTIIKLLIVNKIKNA